MTSPRTRVLAIVRSFTILCTSRSLAKANVDAAPVADSSFHNFNLDGQRTVKRKALDVADIEKKCKRSDAIPHSLARQAELRHSCDAGHPTSAARLSIASPNIGQGGLERPDCLVSRLGPDCRPSSGEDQDADHFIRGLLQSGVYNDTGIPESRIWAHHGAFRKRLHSRHLRAFDAPPVLRAVHALATHPPLAEPSDAAQVLVPSWGRDDTNPAVHRVHSQQTPPETVHELLASTVGPQPHKNFSLDFMFGQTDSFDSVAPASTERALGQSDADGRPWEEGARHTQRFYADAMEPLRTRQASRASEATRFYREPKIVRPSRKFPMPTEPLARQSYPRARTSDSVLTHEPRCPLPDRVGLRTATGKYYEGSLRSQQV